jgi:hypothetical protein
MWGRVRERLLSGIGIMLMCAWLVCSVGIATWLESATGIEVRRGVVGLVALIFLLPIGTVVAFDEFVVHRIKHGPRHPGRHARGVLSSDQLRSLDEGLRRRKSDTSES